MVDWSKMTPREVWDALLSAPAKVAGPWERAKDPNPFNGYVYEWRHRYAGDGCFGSAVYVGPDDRNSNGEDDDPFCVGFFESRAEADAALREAGWTLVDD